MADFGISIAEKLLEIVGSELIEQICDMWGYKSQLNSLKETVSTIQKVLLDADSRRELSYEERNYIDKLKDAMYDADDLFDEFLTLAELKQLGPLSKRGEIYEKVRCFFSSKNQLGQAYRMSRDVNDIKKRLDDIADTHKKFGFSVDYKPIIRRREETCSYVDANEIIGREKDKEGVIDMLLDRNNEEICFTTIVGVGGLGKTALAQLVYDNERINENFSKNLKFWVCVSDQEGEQFNVKTILCKILEVVTHKKYDDSSTLELVQHQFQERLRGKRYLIVLDDVWNEDREKWLDLKRFLMLGESGSRVMVTTRSEKTATIIDEKHSYKLQGLSRDDSWRLFEMSAFDKGIKRENHDELVEIGQKIVHKCYNIPLVLKVLGSLLFGQSISKWHLVEDSELAKIENGDNKIMSTLKLSYYNLTPSLKSCFGYCTIFPKDYIIKKKMLIDLWMAHGYIMSSSDGNQNLVDIAEEYFTTLLRRCFFQDVVKTRLDNIKSVKIHDLMHDVAQEVGREEICVVTSNLSTLGNKVRHVHYFGYSCEESTLGSSKIRSFISQGYGRCVLDVDNNIENKLCLRVLEMSDFTVVKLPNSIGKLQHLRYLNLSKNINLESLPNAITRLYNLQTLILRRCSSLRELPKDFCKLVKLRHLDLLYCDELICMPSDMEKLTSLEMLTYFVVGNRASKDDEFEALKSFTRVRGNMKVGIGGNHSLEEGINVNNRGYLKSMKHLTKVEIKFESIFDYHEGALEALEPPSNVRELNIDFYSGRRIPRWGRAVDNWASSLSRLARIRLSFCQNLREMPVLSKLPLLKTLSLQYLDKLRYMEETTSDVSDIQSTELFFPSLVNLEISNIRKLKGWWKEESSSFSSLYGVDDDNRCCLNKRFKFPCLSELRIYKCPNLMSFPSCPTIEILDLVNTNKRLEIHVVDIDDDATGNPQGDFRLKRLEIDDMGYLNTLGLHHLDALKHLTLTSTCTYNVTSEDKFKACSFPKNLRSLRFTFLHQMTSLPKGMQCLTSLQDLSLSHCFNLKALPEWITCLSSLKSLNIYECPAFKSLPEAMPQLTSLQSLTIWNCPKLQERCKEPDGEDHPKIQHIPRISILK